MRKTLLPALLLVVVLAGCGQGQAGAPRTGAGPTTTSAASAPSGTSTSAPSEPTTAPAPSGASTSAPSEPTAAPAPAATGQPDNALVARARQQLARHLGLNESALTLQSAAAQEWPNGAIGCPQPDQAYIEMITPGFLLTFAGASRSYQVHTDEQGSLIVLCESGRPIDLAATATSAAPTAGSAPAQAGAPELDALSRPLVEKAQQALAQDLGVSAADVKLVSLEAVEWNDSSLGCAKPGMNYLQVIIPGYLIVLEARGQHYEYHTDQQAAVVGCGPA